MFFFVWFFAKSGQLTNIIIKYITIRYHLICYRLSHYVCVTICYMSQHWQVIWDITTYHSLKLPLPLTRDFFFLYHLQEPPLLPQLVTRAFYFFYHLPEPPGGCQAPCGRGRGLCRLCSGPCPPPSSGTTRDTARET